MLIALKKHLLIEIDAMATKYKLIYFTRTGRAEMTRLMFAAAGVKYEDVRIKLEDWPKLKPGRQ